MGEEYSNSIIEQIAAKRGAYSIAEISDLLSISKRALYDMAKERRLPCMYVGECVRVDPKALAEWLTRRATLTPKPSRRK
jgi:excisionase family DNA binding protein